MAHLIIDTDPGVDDAYALAVAAGDRSVDLLAVSTVHGNVGCPATTRNALRVLQLCDRADVDVAAGADRPLVFDQPRRGERTHGDDGLSGRAHLLPETARQPVDRPAVAHLAATLESAEHPVTIVAIGPLTNIALLLAAFPHVAQSIERIVVMGGALAGGNVSATAEFNIASDPEAARRVLVGCDVPCVLVPIDVTWQCAVDTAWLADLAASGPLGSTLRDVSADYIAAYTVAMGRPAMVLHDAVAVAEAITPGTLRTERYPVEVDCSPGPGRGTVLADRRRPEVLASNGWAGREIDVAVAPARGADALRADLLDALR